MSEFTCLLEDYLVFRRATGNALVRAEKLLRQFGSYLASCPQTCPWLFTEEQALSWASMPGGSVSWQSMRLSVVRSFARWLDSRGEPIQVPSLRLLPKHGNGRAVPYQYSDDDIAALMAICAKIFTPYRAETMRTLTGLLTVTGMRIGEAIGLDVSDIDLTDGTITIRGAKGGQDRRVFLRPSSCTAIGAYLRSAARPPAKDPAVFISLGGTRLLYCNTQEGFARMVRAIRLQTQPGAKSRIHDLRHRFAVNSIAAAYEPGAPDSPARTLALLATWLGHATPANTYWYLQASPRLLALAADRLGPCGEGDTP